jgi:hypothetical protein
MFFVVTTFISLLRVFGRFLVGKIASGLFMACILLVEYSIDHDCFADEVLTYLIKFGGLSLILLGIHI